MSPGEEALWAAVKADVPAYTGMNDTYLRFIASGDPKARDYLLDGMLPALNAARAALKADIAFNENQGKRTADEAAALAERARTAIALVVALVALATLAVGWMAGRDESPCRCAASRE